MRVATAMGGSERGVPAPQHGPLPPSPAQSSSSFKSSTTSSSSILGLQAWILVVRNRLRPRVASTSMTTDVAMHAGILSNSGAWSLDPDVATKVGVAEPIVASML